MHGSQLASHSACGNAGCSKVRGTIVQMAARADHKCISMLRIRTQKLELLLTEAQSRLCTRHHRSGVEFYGDQHPQGASNCNQRRLYIPRKYGYPSISFREPFADSSIRPRLCRNLLLLLDLPDQGFDPSLLSPSR